MPVDAPKKSCSRDANCREVVLLENRLPAVGPHRGRARRLQAAVPAMSHGNACNDVVALSCSGCARAPAYMPASPRCLVGGRVTLYVSGLSSFTLKWAAMHRKHTPQAQGRLRLRLRRLLAPPQYALSGRRPAAEGRARGGALPTRLLPDSPPAGDGARLPAGTRPPALASGSIPAHRQRRHASPVVCTYRTQMRPFLCRNWAARAARRGRQPRSPSARGDGAASPRAGAAAAAAAALLCWCRP